MELNEIIRACQRQVHTDDDGKPGIATWEHIYAALFGHPPTANAPAAAIISGGTVDPRSEACIVTLHPRVQPYARSLIQKAAAVGIVIKVISGLRSYEEQTALYAQGRGKPGPKVTNAPAGYSNHNFGLGFDIGVFEGTRYLDDSPKYKAVAPLGIDMGLTWGGNWKTIQDQPHFELHPSWAKDMPESVMLTELRRRKDSGRDYFA